MATTTSHAAAMIKQAEEFGLRKRGQRLAALALTLHDVKALGLNNAQDLFVTEPYYWDQNEQTRAFANRFRARFGKMPNFVQASVYGSIQHYLKAVAAAGTDDTAAVLARMKATPINDMMTRNGTIREDGRVIREGYVFRVKKPSESKGEWDLYAPVTTIPANVAFGPADKACPLIK
jgi:branched-chain amino acid transport system substrate-binding protein